jgi:hypothetical protein
VTSQPPACRRGRHSLRAPSPGRHGTAFKCGRASELDLQSRMPPSHVWAGWEAACHRSHGCAWVPCDDCSGSATAILIFCGAGGEAVRCMREVASRGQWGRGSQMCWGTAAGHDRGRGTLPQGTLAEIRSQQVLPAAAGCCRHGASGSASPFAALRNVCAQERRKLHRPPPPTHSPGAGPC